MNELEEINKLPRQCQCIPQYPHDLILFAVEEKLLQIEHSRKVAEEIADRYSAIDAFTQRSWAKDVEHYKELEEKWRKLANVIRNELTVCKSGRGASR